MIFNSKGKEVEWADITINFNGAQLAKFTGIKFGIPTMKKHLFAEGDMPIGIQSGQRTPKGEITCLKGTLDVINDAAIAAGGRDAGDIEVDCAVYYKPAGVKRLPRTRTIVGMQFSEWQEAMKAGDTEMECTLPFLAMDIF